MNSVSLSLPTRYELSEHKNSTWLPNHFACYFCDKDIKDNVHDQDVFIRNDIPISSSYTSISDTRQTKPINNNSFIGGIVPVIRNTEFIKDHFDGDDIIRYGRFPFFDIDEEDKQMLEQNFLNGNLLFTGNFFINNPEFYIDGMSYVLANKKMIPKYIKLGNNCNFNMNFPYGKDYAKYFEDLQSDYNKNKENYDWIRVDNIYWKYIKYKSNNDTNIETKLICDYVLVRYSYNDNIIDNNLLPFISTDLAYSDYLVQDRVAKYVSIDKYKKVGKISYEIKGLRQINYSNTTTLCYLLTENCNKPCYNIIGNENLFKGKEYPQSSVKYDELGTLSLMPTGKQYHIYLHGDDKILNVPEYINSNDNKKYIIFDSRFYKVEPIYYTSDNGYSKTTLAILGGIPPEKIEEYLYTYFINDIEPSMKNNEVLNLVDRNVGYRYLMNRSGISEEDLQLDGNNLVLKPKQ